MTTNERIDDLLLQGLTPAQIRERVVVIPSRISVRREALGLRKFTPGRPAGTVTERVVLLAANCIEMRKRGATLQEIADELGIPSRRRVHQLIKLAKKLNRKAKRK